MILPFIRKMEKDTRILLYQSTQPYIPNISIPSAGEVAQHLPAGKGQYSSPYPSIQYVLTHTGTDQQPSAELAIHAQNGFKHGRA